MDSSATNYNPAATSQSGVTCTYPPAPVYGCMDSSATNYNPAATSQSGVTCTYPTPPAAPTCTLTANSTSVQTGSPSILSWTTGNATSFSINQGVGAVSPTASGSHSVTPSATVTYTGTATGAGGSITCTATVTVTATPPPAAPTCTLTANPTSVSAGSHSSLSWTTTNAGTFSIGQGVGAVSPAVGGSANSLAINADTTFTGTVVSPTGQVETCTAAVTVTSTGGGSGSAPSCALSVSPASVSFGGSATLSWGGSQIQSVVIDNGIGTTTSVSGSQSVSPGAGSYTYTGTFIAINGQTLTCSAPLPGAAPVVVGGGAGGPPPASGGGGGGGGGSPSPTITLAALPHVFSQPLAYLYLSQIPYTGLDLGPVGTVLYWIALIGWSLALAYLVLFGAAPVANRRLRNFAARVNAALNERELAPVAVAAKAASNEPMLEAHTSPEPPRGYSSYDGFKSYSHNGALSVDDIVKGLSRKHHEKIAGHTVEPKLNVEPVYEKVEPVYEHVEPVYENVETIVAENVTETVVVPPHIRGFAIALVEGDRNAVFAGLRQHLRGGGAPEHLLSKTVCLIDDVYRSRIDGIACDPDMARMTARLDTPTLEKLVTSLTTAIDSSYSTGVTGAKLALTRALTVLGA